MRCLQDVKRVVRYRDETGSRVGISGTKFWNNAALSTGGAQRTFGGGFAAANGAYVVSSSHFWYNVATDGGSVAAVGESNETRCNGNDPPVALVDSTDCSTSVKSRPKSSSHSWSLELVFALTPRVPPL